MGLISIIPNLLPAGMAFGAWSLVSGHIGMGVSIGFTMTLGIVVDDTIHFLSKFNRARTVLNKNLEDALRYAIDSVGTAVIITSATIIIGFSVLLLSQFNPNQDASLITTITIAFALIIDLFILPLILIKAYTNKNENRSDECQAIDSPIHVYEKAGHQGSKL